MPLVRGGVSLAGGDVVGDELAIAVAGELRERLGD